MTKLRQNLKTIMFALHLSLNASRTATLALLIGLILRGLVPPLSLLFIKRLVDHFVVANTLYIPTLTLLIVLVFIGLFLPTVTSTITSFLNERLTFIVSQKIIQKANSFVGLGVFENESTYNDLSIISKQAAYRPVNLVATTVELQQILISSVGMLIVIGSVAWWIPVLLACAYIPYAMASARVQERSWQTILGNQPEIREMDYVRSLVTSDAFAKEIKLFAAGEYFETLYLNSFNKLHGSMNTDRLCQMLLPLPYAMLSFIVGTGCLVYILQFSNTQGALGGIVALTTGFFQLQGLLVSAVSYTGLLTSHLLFFEKLTSFLNLEETERPALPQVAHEFTDLITLQHVDFTYLDGRRALKDISFRIRRGEKVALVGENGAGKSTLVKLLCRFYEPTDGRILVDGVDLSTIAVNDWRCQVRAVFQDFGRYHLTVRENIALGAIEELNQTEKLLDAARAAGLDTLLQQLDNGIETRLGKAFGGTELSGGQWQKLAISRALLRSNALLILDEPSAALDPRAEHELFERVVQDSPGQTVLLVTHRLTSVRMADRIVVLQHGEVAEEGTHEELLAKSGLYAELYTLQASKFERAEDPSELTSRQKLKQRWRI